MADLKISQLTAITTLTPATDILPVVDVTGTTKKITTNQILGSGGTATLASATITGAASVGTTLSVTGVSTFAAGTALLPALTTTGDTNTGIYYPAADTFAVTTGGSERYRVDSSGNVGIGVTPNAWTAGFKVLQIGTGSALWTNNAITRTSLTTNYYYSANDLFIGNGYAHGYWQDGANGHRWFTSSVSNASGAGAVATMNQTMTLDASGNLLVGTTTAEAKLTVLAGASGQSAIFKQPAQNFWCVLAHNQATSGDNSFVMFGTESTFTFRGSITYNRAGGLISYNTTSDYRAKDIIGPVSNSGSLIDSLKVYVGRMKGATIERPMLIAHEAQEVAPYAVTGTKDEVDADGKPKYQQMDASALVPLLIAEIQSLRARVQTLETR